MKLVILSGCYRIETIMSFPTIIAARPIIITTAAGASVCALLLSLLGIGLKPPGLMME